MTTEENILTYYVTVGDGRTYKEVMDALERSILAEALQTGQSKAEIARWLGVERTTLFQKLRKHKLLKRREA